MARGDTKLVASISRRPAAASRRMYSSFVGSVAIGSRFVLEAVARPDLVDADAVRGMSVTIANVTLPRDPNRARRASRHAGPAGRARRARARREPAPGAGTVFSIFIASSTTSTWPASTSSPSATRGHGEDVARHRRDDRCALAPSCVAHGDGRLDAWAAARGPRARARPSRSRTTAVASRRRPRGAMVAAAPPATPATRLSSPPIADGHARRTLSRNPPAGDRGRWRRLSSEAAACPGRRGIRRGLWPGCQSLVDERRARRPFATSGARPASAGSRGWWSRRARSCRSTHPFSRARAVTAVGRPWAISLASSGS